MKKIFVGFLLVPLLSCNTGKTNKDQTADNTAGLPYKATYSSNWTTDVSDADVKTVLMSYKYWADGNIDSLAGCFADTIDAYVATGEHLHYSKGDLAKLLASYRDSISSSVISMAGWHKMYAPDQKEPIVVTWFKETDTYKSGVVDSAQYHEVNKLKDGKIFTFLQYKRPLK